MGMNRLTANALILLTALIWGFAFVAQQKAMEYIGAFAFTGVRFLMGALVVLPLAIWETRRNTPTSPSLAPSAQPLPQPSFGFFALLGCLLFLAALTQQIGIGQTTVVRSGFITALYVPLVPLVGWLIFRIPPRWHTYPAMILCVIGLLFITGALESISHSNDPALPRGESSSSFNRGDGWVLLSTIFWALHVNGIDHALRLHRSPARLATTQFWVCGILGLIGSVFFESLLSQATSSAFMQALPYLLFTGLLSAGVGFTIQVFAQQYTRANDVAILLSAEFVFSALAGIWLLSEPFGMHQWIGGGLILASVLIIHAVNTLDSKINLMILKNTYRSQTHVG